MDATAILEKIKGLGVTTTIEGDRLRFEPGSRLPKDFLSQIHEHKTEIIAHLNKPKLVEGLPQLHADTIAAAVQNEGVFVFWSELFGETIAFIRDDSFRDKIPCGIVAYSDKELRELFDDGKPGLQSRDLILIHEAKKAGGCISSHMTKEEGGR